MRIHSNVFCSYILTITACLSLAGCAFSNTQPRTVDAAKAYFDQGTFTPKATTQKDVKARLGSPSEIRKLDAGRELWAYIKTQEVGLFTVTTDTATSNIGEYTFDQSGVLLESNYLAAPSGNPLVR